MTEQSFFSVASLHNAALQFLILLPLHPFHFCDVHLLLDKAEKKLGGGTTQNTKREDLHK